MRCCTQPTKERHGTETESSKIVELRRVLSVSGLLGVRYPTSFRFFMVCGVFSSIRCFVCLTQVSFHLLLFCASPHQGLGQLYEPVVPPAIEIPAELGQIEVFMPCIYSLFPDSTSLVTSCCSPVDTHDVLFPQAILWFTAPVYLPFCNFLWERLTA